MTWYAAHVISGMKRHDSKGPISVHENVLLIEAKTIQAARRMAAYIGDEEANLIGGLTIDGEPANYFFAGVRKVLMVSNPDPYDQTEERPTTGTEITFSEFEVPDEAALVRLAEGKSLNIRYIEHRRISGEKPRAKK